MGKIRWAWRLALLACWPCLIPVHLVAASSPGRSSSVQDVQLGGNGLLRGMCRDSSGRPLPGVPIVIRHQLRPVMTVRTDSQGVFSVKEMRGGVYQFEAPDAVSVVRVWAEGTAPPQAKEAVTLVSEPDRVRAQRPFAEVITNPLVVAAVIAAAIAIPIAVHNSGSDREGS